MGKADEPCKIKHSVKMKVFLLSQIEYTKTSLQLEQDHEMLLQSLPHGIAAALNISAISEGAAWCHAQIHASTDSGISRRTKDTSTCNSLRRLELQSMFRMKFSAMPQETGFSSSSKSGHPKFSSTVAALLSLCSLVLP